MLDSKQKFQELVKQMKALQENEKGQLKGGFIPIPSKKISRPSGNNNGICLNGSC